MTNAILSTEEMNALDEISSKYYMKPILEKLNKFIEKFGYIKSLDYLYEVLVSAKDEVEILLVQRKENGVIRDIPQARKSIAGSAFANLVIYTFIKAKESGEISEKVFITDKTKSELFQELVTINIDGETQKPDMDLAIYSKKEDGSIKKLIIISLKTSLRERAGQTYRWKLLLEIATTPNDIREKYGISYSTGKMPLVCFATVNFYNEVKNPQHRGMFKFFDNSFIAKPIDTDFIKRLSELASYAEKELVQENS